MKIYVISQPNAPFDEMAAILQRGKRRIVAFQYRNKAAMDAAWWQEARRYRARCRRLGITFIVNDYLSVARRLRADGVHIGKNDGQRHGLQYGIYHGLRRAIRARPYARFIIGASCYNEYKRAVRAAKLGADYAAFGALFASPTKPNAPRVKMATVQKARTLPITIGVIGGINARTISTARRTRADWAATITGAASILKNGRL